MDEQGWIFCPELPREDEWVTIRAKDGFIDRARLTDNQLMYPGEPLYWVGESDTYELGEVECWKVRL